MLCEVDHPYIEEIGEKFEKRPAGVEFADPVLHVDPHALAGYIGDERIEVSLVGEVLEQTAFGHPCTSSNDIEAAAGKAVRGELRLRGCHHRCPALPVEPGPRNRRHRASTSTMTTGHITVIHATVNS